MNMKIIHLEKHDSENIIQAKKILQDNGIQCSIEELENLAEMDKLVAQKNLEFKISQLEYQIAELEELYKQLTYRVRGFIKMDISSCKMIIIDKFLAELSGYSIDIWEKTPNFIQTIVHSDFKEYYSSCIDELKRGIIPKLMEYEIVKKNGEQRWWLQFNIGAFDIHGKLVSISAIIIDGTEQKNAERKIAESEERFRSLLEQSVAGIIIIKDNKIIFANDVIFKQSGYDHSQINTQSLEQIFQIVHPEDHRFVKSQFNKVEELGVVPEFYFRIISKDKSVIWLSAQLKKFTYEGQTAISCIMVEVTKRVTLEQKLQHEHRLAQSYFDIAGVMLLVLDKNANVVQINKRGCEILGYTKEEIIGKNWIHTFLPNRIRTAVQQTFDKCMNEKISPDDCFENYVLTKEGKEKLILWHNALLKDSNGNIEAVISSGEDITIPRIAEKIIGDNEIKNSQKK